MAYVCCYEVRDCVRKAEAPVHHIDNATSCDHSSEYAKGDEVWDYEARRSLYLRIAERRDHQSEFITVGGDRRCSTARSGHEAPQPLCATQG